MPKNKFKCKRCGECRNLPRLSKKDIQRIEKLGFKKEYFVEKDFRNINYMKEGNEKCIFLKRNKKAGCKIYKARPDICRLYPTKLMNNDCKPETLTSDRLFIK